jgi:hypothetical protein
MEIVVSQEQGRVPVTVFRLTGDLTSDEPLQSQAQEAFKAGTRNLILDLTQVPYISSRGLRLLHNLYMLLRTDAPAESDAATRAGVLSGTFKSPHLKLLNPSKDALKVLSLAGYDMFLEIYHNLEEAIASF